MGDSRAGVKGFCGGNMIPHCCYSGTFESCGRARRPGRIWRTAGAGQGGGDPGRSLSRCSGRVRRWRGAADGAARRAGAARLGGGRRPGFRRSVRGGRAGAAAIPASRSWMRCPTASGGRFGSGFGGHGVAARRVSRRSRTRRALRGQFRLMRRLRSRVSPISRDLGCSPPQRLQGVHQPREKGRQILRWGEG